MMEKLAQEGRGDQGSWNPAVDIFETNDAVVIVAEVAGVNQKDLRVIVDGNLVRIYGQREPTCCEGGAHFHRMEIESGGFVRSFRIGVPFNSDKVQAHTADGLLFVTLPKEKHPRERKIRVTKI
jgi:HSP20 family protein